MSTKRQTRKELGGIAELRKVSGAWLREKRELAGLSQRALAGILGIDYYTFVSQIEAGRGKVPSDRYEVYADAVGVDAREFALVMLRNSEPELYRMIFEEAEGLKDAGGSEDHETRLARLEARLKLSGR